MAATTEGDVWRKLNERLLGLHIALHLREVQLIHHARDRWTVRAILRYDLAYAKAHADGVWSPNREIKLADMTEQLATMADWPAAVGFGATPEAALDDLRPCTWSATGYVIEDPPGRA